MSRLYPLKHRWQRRALRQWSRAHWHVWRFRDGRRENRHPRAVYFRARQHAQARRRGER